MLARERIYSICHTTFHRATMSVKRKAPDTNGTAEKKARSITSFFGAPAGGSTGQASKSTIRFNKKEWVDSLNAEQKDLLQLEINTLDDSWLSVLKDTLTERYFLDLKRFLKGEVAEGRTFYPPQEEIYSWSRHTPLNSVKVLILGQDPYHNTNQAHGLSFSVKPPTKAPPSLKNMFIALKRDYPSFVPPANGEGLLLPWADRGVLMLNACLTVMAHTANSHAGKGWETLTQKVIDVVAAKRTHGVVFMSWGSPAAKRVAKVDRTKHLVLQAVHPSPLSAHRGFFDCEHFKKANEWLVKRYGPDGGIDWNSIGKGPALFSADGDGAPGPSKILPVSSIKSTATAKPFKPVPVVDDLADDEEAMREMEAAESSASGPSATKASLTSEGTLDEFEDADGPIDWAEAENVMEAKEKHTHSEDAPAADK